MDRPPDPAPTNLTDHPEVHDEQDYILRAQIGATEFFLKYGKYAGYVVLAVLVGAAGYSTYDSHRHAQSQDQFGKIAAIDFKMPKPDPKFAYGFGPEDDLTDPKRVEDLSEGARRYEAVAAEADGSARTLAWLKAAEAWKRAGKQEESLAAAGHATEGGGTSLTSFAADSQRFAALADSGKNDEAEALLREMAGRYDGFFAEESLIRLGEFQVDLGKNTEALATYTEIGTRFTTSNDPAGVAELASRLGKVAPAAEITPPAGTP